MSLLMKFAKLGHDVAMNTHKIYTLFWFFFMILSTEAILFRHRLISEVLSWARNIHKGIDREDC